MSEFRSLGDLNHLFHQFLACVVVRVSLPENQELHRMMLVVHNACQAIQITEDERSPLIGR